MARNIKEKLRKDGVFKLSDLGESNFPERRLLLGFFAEFMLTLAEDQTPDEPPFEADFELSNPNMKNLTSSLTRLGLTEK